MFGYSWVTGVTHEFSLLSHQRRIHFPANQAIEAKLDKDVLTADPAIEPGRKPDGTERLRWSHYGVQKLAAAYPTEKQSLMAQIGAAKIYLKQNRAQEALALYETAKNSAIPHLDWEQTIEAGIRSAKAALDPKGVAAIQNARAQGRGV